MFNSGVAFVQVEQASAVSQGSGVAQNWMVGLAAILVICLSSGFAGVYYEKILKDSAASVWIQNVRLALLGVPLNCGIVLSKDLQVVMHDGFFVGYDRWVWFVVLLTASGGLLIAIVVKYANNILKSYAQGVAVVVSCIGSNFMFGFVINATFVVGVTLVVTSILLYAQFPPASRYLSVVPVVNGAEVKLLPSQPESLELSNGLKTP